MHRSIIAFATIAFLSLSVHAEPTRYVFDKEHTTILFFVDHLGFSDKIGQFREYEGELWWDEKNPEKSSVSITLKPASVDSGSTALDKVLQDKDWFNTAQYPDITFKSTQVKVTGGNTADVTGWMTLLGKEKPVTMQVTFNKSGVHPVNKKFVSGFSLKGALKRSAFGMENGIPMVGDEVRFLAEVECFSDSPAEK